MPQIAKSDSIKNEPGTEPVFGAVESPCISGAMHRNPPRFRVFAPCVTPNNGWGAFGVYLKTIGIVDMHDFRTPRPSGFRDGYFLGHTKGEIMSKFLISIIGTLIIGEAFAAGENIPTSKSYVDATVAEKQDKISANDGVPQILTNTGTAGEYGTKNIYDTSGEYSTQTDALIDAQTMNTAVQNAIDSEFQCVEWVDNDPTKDCLLMDVKKTTNVLQNPVSLNNAIFDSATATLSNTWTTNKDYMNLYLWYADRAVYSSSGQVIITMQNFRQGQTYKNTFTTGPTTHYFYIKHNDSKDIGAYFELEPSTTYTVIVKALETDLSVVGGLKVQVMLVRGNYAYEDVLPYGENIYIPQN